MSDMLSYYTGDPFQYLVLVDFTALYKFRNNKNMCVLLSSSYYLSAYVSF